MSNILTKALDGFRGSKRVAPGKIAGAPSVSVRNGWVESGEKNPAIAQLDNRIKTYSETMANVSVVATGVRYFLNTCAAASLSMEQAEDDTEGEWMEKAATALRDDPETPFRTIVRRAAMARFLGFSIQEWVTNKHDDGHLTFMDIMHRSQSTIDQWDVDDNGRVIGLTQRHPDTQQEHYLPRAKIMYMVDDTLHDSPEGVGLLRHVVEPVQRLRILQQLEGIGFETDLRGIPILRAPFTEIRDAVKKGDLTDAQAAALEAPLKSFLRNHKRGEGQLAMALDSATLRTTDDKGSPSQTYKWDVQLLEAQSESLADLDRAIMRVTLEIARILGIEQLLLGASSAGSFALSADKTKAFLLMVDGTLAEIAEAIQKDLLTTLWDLNGWDKKLMPTVRFESVRTQDVEAIGAALRDLATSGAPVMPNDPAVLEFYDLLGLPRPPIREEEDETDEDASLRPKKTDDKGKPKGEGKETPEAKGKKPGTGEQDETSRKDQVKE